MFFFNFLVCVGSVRSESIWGQDRDNGRECVFNLQKNLGPITACCKLWTIVPDELSANMLTNPSPQDELQALKPIGGIVSLHCIRRQSMDIFGSWPNELL